MILKSKCNKCLRKVAIEGEAVAGAVVCPNCNGTIQMPRVILEQGDELGNFVVNRHIGSGAMGDVYLATQVNMGRDVAIKIIPPEISEDPETIQDFLSEVRTLAKLDHPNIVTAFEAGEAEGHYFLAMTYLDGGSLEDRVQHDGPLPEAEALRVVLRVAQALSYAWDTFGIIHRDVKPENVMMDSRMPEPKVLDLGISKVIGDDRNLQSGNRTLVGTPYYMSPEQADARDDLDFRTDVYSLGCTLYHLLTGHVPFDAETPLQVLTRHRIDPIPNPAERVESLQRPTVALVMQMMAKLPNDRCDSWAEIINAIKQCLKHARTATRRYEPVSTVTNRLDRPSIRSAYRDEVLEETEDDDDSAPTHDAVEPDSKMVPILVLVLCLLLGGIGLFIFVANMRSRAAIEEFNKTIKEPDGTKSHDDKPANPKDNRTSQNQGNPDLQSRYLALMSSTPDDAREAEILCETIDDFLPQLSDAKRIEAMTARRQGILKTWTEEVMEGLHGKARSLRKQRKNPLTVYTDYDGPFKEETTDARSRAVASIKKRNRRRK